jgi:hypothetical protein
MAVNLAGMFQDLIAAASEAAGPLRYANTFLNSIYWDNKPIATSPYTALRVNIPNVTEGDVQDIGVGSIRLTNPDERAVSIALDKNYSTAFVVKEWISGRSPRNLKDEYLAPRIEALARKMNNTIAALVNSTNFSAYSIVGGAGADKFERADITNAWTNLARAGVPVADRGRVFFTTTPTAYGAMLGDSNFVSNYIVAPSAAESAQQKAELVNAYGSIVQWDQHLQPFEAGKEPGVLFHKFAIAGLNRLPESNAPEGQIEETVLNLAGPNGPRYRMQMWYSPDDQGYKVHINTWWGVAVARPEMGALLQSA